MGSIETHSDGGGGPIGHFFAGANAPPQDRPNGYHVIPLPDP